MATTKVKISDSVSTTSSEIAASSTAVKTAYDLANSKASSFNGVTPDSSGNIVYPDWKIYPHDAVSETNPCISALCVIRSNADIAPNNGVILSYGNSDSWVGQLYIGDNATQGVYYKGCSDGVWGEWKKLLDSSSTITATVCPNVKSEYNTSGSFVIPSGGTWAYQCGTNYRGWGTGSSDGAHWGGTASGGTTIGVDSRGTACLAIRIS